MAPSSHNSQPWKFKISTDDNAIHLYADRTRALSVVDPDDRELTISCGCALFNLQLAISYFGYKFKTSLLPDEEHDRNLLATVKVIDIDEKPNKKKDDKIRRLFNSITKRRTNRFGFDNENWISERIIYSLQAIIQEYEGVWIHIEKKKEEKNNLLN